MTTKIDRRRLLAGAAAGPVILALSGCAGKDAGDARRHRYVMVFDQNKCVGCGDCKKACNKTNKLPEGVSRVLLERQSHATRKVGVEPCPVCGSLEACDCERKYVRVSCQQCEDAPCVRVCPTGAAHRDPETGIVTMDASKCVGCKYCLVACPYNARFINKETKAAENCDFCLRTRLRKGREPGCVEACRFEALSFGNLNDEKSYVSRLLAVKDTVRVRPELGTKPTLRYIPKVRTGV